MNLDPATTAQVLAACGVSRPAPPPAGVTEAEFQAAVIAYARERGWRCAAFRPARTAKGWRTAVTADGAGFPDLVLVRQRVLFLELKADRGRLRPNQAAWLVALRAARAEAYCWRPDDWPMIVETLT